MSRLQDAIDRIAFARMYTLRILDTIPQSDWFKTPAEGVTHVAWQVGHLAMAEYRLTLIRTRGELVEDEQLIPRAFVAFFRGDPQLNPDAATHPSAAEIRATFDRVHETVLETSTKLGEADLDSPIDPPHPIAKTKLQALHWCAAHELVHAGQIALLRRLFGQKPIW